MACEIEIKAHVKDEDFDAVKERLSKVEGSQYLGTTDKEDIYWAHDENDPPVFRTRKAVENGIPKIIFTSKPLKNKDYKTEINVENEFEVASAQWERIIEFVKGLDFKICRLKWKRGCHFNIPVNGFNIHAELLYVRHLGTFLEMEICSSRLEDINQTDAEKALYDLLHIVGLSDDDVEARGYNKMLTDIGRQRG